MSAPKPGRIGSSARRPARRSDGGPTTTPPPDAEEACQEARRGADAEQRHDLWDQLASYFRMQ